MGKRGAQGVCFTWEIIFDNASGSLVSLQLVFSGHGAHGPGGSFVCLNNNEEVVSVSELAQLGRRVRRIVVISDACREQVYVPVTPPTKIVTGEVAGIPDATYRRSCRLAYTNAFRDATEGAVVMYSCKVKKLFPPFVGTTSIVRAENERNDSPMRTGAKVPFAAAVKRIPAVLT